MTIALCIRCGSKKSGAMTACRSCDYAPSNDKEMAYSLALSDHYFELEDLEHIATEISEYGKCPLLPRQQEDELVKAVATDRTMQSLLHFNAVNNEAAAAKNNLPPAEFQFIGQLPLFIFLLIAGADRNIDKKEISAFSDLLRAPVCARTFKSPLFKALVLFGNNQMDASKETEFQPDYAEAASSLVRHHCSDDEFVEFVNDVQSFALIIAGSSGGLFGIGSKISKVERRAIAALKSAFAVQHRQTVAATTPSEFALTQADAFERLFKDTFGIPADHREIAAYVASIVDFCLQANVDGETYKFCITQIVGALASRNRITSDQMARLVGDRAAGYVKLTLNALREVRGSDGSPSTDAEVQLAWELFSCAAHSDPRGHMIELITGLAPMMTHFVVAAERFAQGLASNPDQPNH